MMEYSIFNEIMILLVTSVFAVTLFHRFRLPAVLAYLIIGVVIGPYALAWIPENEDTRLLAEFGVVFLLFTVGLEFPLGQLAAMRREVLGLGGAQVVLTIVLVVVVCVLLGFAPAAAFVIGGVLALSSTAIVVKQLKERVELSTRHGRLAIGILLFQDLAVIPFLILIPTLAGEVENSIALTMTLAMIKGGIVVAVMLAIGHWLLRPLFRFVATSRSSELFTLMVLLTALAAAWVTHELGLSLALGAFLAGMMLAETEFRHQVEIDIRPFRDVLLGLFFITVGMLLDVRSLFEVLHWVFLLVVAIVLAKIFIIVVISRLMGISMVIGLRTGIVLAQGGEFGFALLSLALSGQVLLADQVQVILAAILLSMLLTPLLIQYNGRLASWFFTGGYAQENQGIADSLASAAKDVSEHTIICGYGRVGQNVARFLEQENFSYLALDLDPLRVRLAREAGEQVNYGDAAHLKILEAAGLLRAKAVVVSFEDYYAAIKILALVRQLRPDIPVLVRTADDTNLERLQEAGATEVIPENLEASLMLSSHLLILLGVSIRHVLHKIEDVRGQRYQMLRGFFHGQDSNVHKKDLTHRERLHTFILSPDSHAVGHTLDEYRLQEIGVTVNALRRHGVRGEEPDADLMLQSGDTLILYGAPESLLQAEQRLANGWRGMGGS
jgi:CPA2 family monovalent cation:H+ antiporter-2